MAVKVCKFGGTSLADAVQIRKVIDIVRDDPQRRVVVPSAPGKRHGHDQKITDLFYLCHEHARQDLPFDEVFSRITERFEQIITGLGISLDLSEQFVTIQEQIASGAINGMGPDYAASRGEYLNGQILAAGLGYAFVDAAEVILFDESGKLDEDRTYAALHARLASDGAIVPGFYGSMPDGSIKTFTRGGSDVTGAIVARGVSALVYENWSDVSGLLMADPNIVDNPRTIRTVTYQELRELSYMGARVLHDEAVFPARNAGIPVNIRNTNKPEHPGSTIVSSAMNPQTIPGTISGIAGRKDFTVIAIEKALMNAERGYGRRVLDVLERHGISFEHMPSGIDTLSVVVSDSELEGKLEIVLDELRRDCEPDTIEVQADVALIATVGRGMAATPGMAARLFAALAEAQVNIRMIDQGSSELNIIVGVAVKDFETAVRAIYDAFVR